MQVGLGTMDLADGASDLAAESFWRKVLYPFVDFRDKHGTNPIGMPIQNFTWSCRNVTIHELTDPIPSADIHSMVPPRHVAPFSENLLFSEP